MAYSPTPAALASNPSPSTPSLPVRLTGPKSWRTTFANAISNGVDTSFLTLLQTGSGQTVNQTGGNLVVTTGTTVNSETVIRSNTAFSTANGLLRFAMILSQRIVNQNFLVEMVDVIGDGLAYTINSATSVTVTIPGTTFTSANVGQGITIGVITGAAGVPMRATIASVSGTAVTLTVAGWPASGTGTCSLFGWNYIQTLYDSTTATANKFDTQRRGWNSGYTTTAINTTAGVGHVSQVYYDEANVAYEDGLAASSGASRFVTRADRCANIPAAETPMYIQIRVLNGTTAPASTTTMTLGFVSVEESPYNPVTVLASRQHGQTAALPVVTMNSQAITGTVTTSLASTTVTASTPVAPTASTLVTAATNNLTSTKASAGTVYAVALSNTTATPMYFKLYNKASAPVVASDVPVATIPMAANSHVVYEYGAVGLRFGTGIAWACTGAIGDTDATNAVVGGKVFLSYI